jgi:hypothetical protein
MSEFDTTGTEPDQTLLASMYLDGEATSDERALVETSPDAMAEVDELGKVRTVLAATAPEAMLSEREAHLAVALDVWERMGDLERSGEATPSAGIDAAAAAALSTPISSSDARRKRGAKRSKSNGGFGGSQWFLSAAAVLVVFAGGGAILLGILDQEPAVDQLAVQQLDEEPASEAQTIEEQEAAEVAGENTNDDALLSADQLEDQVFSADTAESPASDTGLFADEEAMEEKSVDDAASAEPAVEGAASDDVPAGGQQASPASDAEELTPLATPEDLADFGSLSVSSVTGSADDIPDVDFEPPAGSCEAGFGVEKRAGFALYRGQPVQVGVDVDGRTVYAYTDACVLVASAPLPDGERGAEVAPATTNP